MGRSYGETQKVTWTNPKTGTEAVQFVNYIIRPGSYWEPDDWEIDDSEDPEIEYGGRIITPAWASAFDVLQDKLERFGTSKVVY